MNEFSQAHDLQRFLKVHSFSCNAVKQQVFPGKKICKYRLTHLDSLIPPATVIPNCIPVLLPFIPPSKRGDRRL